MSEKRVFSQIIFSQISDLNARCHLSAIDSLVFSVGDHLPYLIWLKIMSFLQIIFLTVIFITLRCRRKTYFLNSYCQVSTKSIKNDHSRRPDPIGSTNLPDNLFVIQTSLLPRSTFLLSRPVLILL
jgi:hypothetical protein